MAIWRDEHKFMVPEGQSGEYIDSHVLNALNRSNATIPTNTMVAIPFMIGRRDSLSAIQFTQSGTEVGGITGGIYTDKNGRPDTRLAVAAEKDANVGQGTIDMAFSADVEVPPIFWVVMYSSCVGTAGWSVVVVGKADFAVFSSDIAFANSAGAHSCFTASQTYSAGAMPSNFPTSGFATSVDAVAVRVKFA